MISLLHEFQEMDERFKLGLTMFTEGAQGFHDNLRILLDVYLVQENIQQFYVLMQKNNLFWNFCIRSEASFILVDSISLNYH